ncbi:MAG TPA: polyphosphate kinase 1 [Pyrinomonadaceae bacterium]|jgi:polyphosphate kinase|nr:polyphosphate kinase 1 [Pyrinomonadaceae bacterium]
MSQQEPSGNIKPKRFFSWSVLNRDLCQVEFFKRVLEEATDKSTPLLEKLKFLSIFSSNLDEFFMVRVSGIKEMLGIDDIGPMPGELTPPEQLAVIRQRVLPLVAEQTRCLRDEVLPELESHGVEIAPYATLSEEEKHHLAQYFTKNIFLVLTPQAVDPARPFPYISNLSLNIGLTVESSPEETFAGTPLGNEIRFVRIKVPPVVPRLIPVGQGTTKFALVEEVIEANLHSLFPRMRLSKGHVFRVTRDADVEIRDDKAADLLALIKESLRERRFGLAVRLEVASTMPAEMVEYLTTSLRLEPDDVYKIDGLLDISDLMELYSVNEPELKDKPLKTVVAPALRNKESLFSAIKKQDVLLHHPYASFGSIVDFIDAAAKDPDVVAIKMCLYRTGKKSPIPQALIEASERGKQVTCVVELKARFDEEHNIEWAERLAESGVHVVYGLVGLKTHSKVTLVVRREEHGLQTYTHIASGNYNPTTSRFYTDLGLLTSDSIIGDDASDVFNFLTGFSVQKEYSRLMVAPLNLRKRMVALIKRETEHALAGQPAHIQAKINRLTDLSIIELLYEASQAGVKIDLIVRGACMIRPGEPGLSQTIHVRSVVGRFLEHSRIYYFANGGEEELYIGSADWMSRNLDRRVEVVTPVLDEQLQDYLKNTVLAAYFRDNVKARVMNSAGIYERPPMAEGEEPFDCQLFFEGANSSPSAGNVHPLKSKRLWSKQ